MKPEVRVLNGPLMPQNPQMIPPGATVSMVVSPEPVAESATFAITKAAVLKATQAITVATAASAEAIRLQRIEAALVAAGYTEEQLSAVAAEGLQGIMDLAAALLGKS